jgi:hypothetical protein
MSPPSSESKNKTSKKRARYLIRRYIPEAGTFHNHRCENSNLRGPSSFKQNVFWRRTVPVVFVKIPLKSHIKQVKETVWTLYKQKCIFIKQGKIAYAQLSDIYSKENKPIWYNSEHACLAQWYLTRSLSKQLTAHSSFSTQTHTHTRTNTTYRNWFNWSSYLPAIIRYKSNWKLYSVCHFYILILPF